MTGWLSRAILGILGAAILSAAARELAGEGRTGSAVRLITGALVLFSLLQPIVSFDWSVYASCSKCGRCVKRKGSLQAVVKVC